MPLFDVFLEKREEESQLKDVNIQKANEPVGNIDEKARKLLQDIYQSIDKLWELGGKGMLFDIAYIRFIPEKLQWVIRYCFRKRTKSRFYKCYASYGNSLTLEEQEGNEESFDFCWCKNSLVVQRAIQYLADSERKTSFLFSECSNVEQKTMHYLEAMYKKEYLGIRISDNSFQINFWKILKEKATDYFIKTIQELVPSYYECIGSDKIDRIALKCKIWPEEEFNWSYFENGKRVESETLPCELNLHPQIGMGYWLARAIYEDGLPQKEYRKEVIFNESCYESTSSVDEFDQTVIEMEIIWYI